MGTLLSPFILLVVALLAYTAAFISQIFQVFAKPSAVFNQCWIGFSVLAFLSHAGLLHVWIDLPTGQNLSGANIFSLMTWLSVLMMFLSLMKRPLQNISLFLFPLAIFSLLYGFYYPSVQLEQTGGSFRYFSHVWLGVLTLSLLVNVLFQALLCSIQDKLLRTHRFHRLLRCFPALESMENFFFQMVFYSFIVLSILLMSSVFSFSAPFAWPIVQKISLTFLIWVVFAVMLVGHRIYGWRRLAMCFIFMAVLLMTFFYFLLRVIH